MVHFYRRTPSPAHVLTHSLAYPPAHPRTHLRTHLPIAYYRQGLACVECHRAKAACEGDPCVRCIRLGKTCVTLARLPRRRRIKSGEDRAAGGGKAAALAPPAEVVAPFAPPSAARPAPMPEAGTRRTKAPKLSDAPFGQVLDADFVDARLLSDPPEAPAFANPVPSQVPAFATSAGPGAGISDDCMFLSTDELTSLITAVDF